MAECKDYRERLLTFLSELGRWGKDKYLLKEIAEGRLRAYLYTDGHCYAIDATDTGYLGCVVSSRKPRPGEDWTRGSDLADGKLNEETWNLILRDIVAYELKTISDYILNPPSNVVEEETPITEALRDKLREMGTS